MQPSAALPMPDPDKVRALLPLTRQLFQRHEQGLDYTSQSHALSRHLGRVVSRFELHAAFGSGSPEHFAERLAIDWTELHPGLSKAEMLRLLEAVCAPQHSPVLQEYWLKCLEANTGDHRISDLIFYPEDYFGPRFDGQRLTPAEMLDVALQSGGLSGSVLKD